MTQILQLFINKFVVVYFDDILIFSTSYSNHLCHLCQIFQVLRFDSFYIHLTKCNFARDSVLFLGFIISASGISTDSSKVKAILDWLTPTIAHEVQSFHGLASFY